MQRVLVGVSKSRHMNDSYLVMKVGMLAMKVAFFPGCMVDMFYPQVGAAAVEVMERLGCEVVMPKEQLCCGQMFSNGGYVEEVKPFARQIIDAYEEYDTIVALSGSCMYAILNDYPDILKDDGIYAARHAKMRDNFYEFTDFIVNKLGVTNVGAHYYGKVTYHKSCHLTRFLGIKEPPLKLLEGVTGLELVEMQHPERCCGFGGTFSIKEPEISAEIVDEKCQYIIESGADAVCGADIACLMNIKGRMERLKDEGKLDRDIQVLHIAEILNY